MTISGNIVQEAASVGLVVAMRRMIGFCMAKRVTDARSRIRRITDARRYRQANPIQPRKGSRMWRMSRAVIGNRESTWPCEQFRSCCRMEIVECKLDDASTKKYINADVAAELGLTGSVQKVQVSVLNNKTESFETMPISFDIESIDGKTRTTISAFTTNRVTGDVHAIDWNMHKHQWRHLQGIKFQSLGKRPIIDISIGIDYADLHEWTNREIDATLVDVHW